MMQDPSPRRAGGERTLAEATRCWTVIEFRRLLETLPAGAYMCDPNGLITYFNRRAVQLWGRAPKLNDPEDRFCGSFKLFSPDGSPIRHEQCWMALALSRRSEYNGCEIVIERPDGQRLTVLAHANPICDEAGALLGAVNVLVDITKRKQAEDALRTADRSKDEFLAMLAHELRNPLAPIRNAVQILHLQGLSALESKWALDVIDRQMQQMTRLIDDLMDVSRITRNKLGLRIQRIELATVIHSAVETSRPLLEMGGHAFTLTLPPEPIHLDADPTRLAQALSNLLNNAAKYTEPGGHIWFSAERQGSEAVVTVRDNGIGIPVERLPLIFDMFTQGHESEDQSQGGLGIGLTLAKRLVEMHGGTLQVHSDGPGKGSEFTARLPAVIASLPIPLAGAGVERTAAASLLRILVVDDNRDSAASLAMLLQIVGNHTRTAHDGLEAVAMASEFRPDAVVLDIDLPKMNGYDVARKIRQQPWGKAMVLIAVTGLGQEEDKQRSKDAGFDHHMVKPVDLDALVKLLASLQKPVKRVLAEQQTAKRYHPDAYEYTR